MYTHEQVIKALENWEKEEDGKETDLLDLRAEFTLET